MAIEFQCPGCKKPYSVPENLAGKRVRCKSCGHVLDVPAPKAVALPDEPKPRTAGKPAKAPRRPPPQDPLPAVPVAGFVEDDDLEPIPWDRVAPLKQSEGIFPVLWAAIGVGAGAIVLLVLMVLVLSRGNRDSQEEIASQPPEVEQVERPSPPAPSSTRRPTPPRFRPEELARPPNRPPSTTPSRPTTSARPNRPATREPETPPEQPEPEPPKLTPWTAEVDPPPETFEIAPNKDFSLSLPGSCDVHYPATPSPFFVLRSKDHGNEAIAVFDLRTEKRTGIIRGKTPLREIQAVSPDGKYVAGMTDFFKKEAQVWSFESGEVVQTLSPPGGNKRFRTILFADAGQLLLTTDQRDALEIFLWNANQPEQSRTLAVPCEKSPEEHALALSPGGRYAVMMVGDMLTVYELATGKCVGQSPLPDLSEHHRYEYQDLAFAPDGTEIVGLFRIEGTDTLFCWNFADGELLVEDKCDYLSGSGGYGSVGGGYDGPPIEWIPDKSGWIYRGHVLLDRQTGGPIWQLPVTSDQPRRMFGPDHIMLMGRYQRGGQQIMLAKLPKQEIAKAREAVRAGGAGIDGALPPLADYDMSGARMVIKPTGPGPWEVRSEPPPDDAKLPKRPVRLGRAISSMTAVRFSRDTRRIAVLGKSGAGSMAQVLQRYSVSDGLAGKQITLPVLYNLLDVSPQGDLALLGIRTPKPPSQDRLDVWSLQTGRHVIGWRPYRDASESNDRGVNWAAFVDEDHALTVNPAGTIRLWKLPECQTVYSMENGDPLTALSRSGAYLAAAEKTDGSFRIFEAMTGKYCGKTETPSERIGVKGPEAARPLSASFRPDGTALAATVQNGVLRWNMADGKLAMECPLPFSPRPDMAWCAEQYLLLGTELLDMENRTVIWRYRILQGCPIDSSPTNRFWLCLRATGESPPRYWLTAWELPNEEARRATADLRLEDNLLLYPGVEVSVSGSVPGLDAREVAGILTEKLQANGVKVVPNASVHVTLGTSEHNTGDTLELRSMFGMGSRLDSMAHREARCRLSVVDDKGRTWENEVPFQMPSSGRVEEGEDWKRKLRDQMYEAVAGYVERIRIPKHLFPTDWQKEIGGSQLTMQGELPLPRETDQPAAVRR